MATLATYRRIVLIELRAQVELGCMAVWAGYGQTCNEAQRHPPCPVCVAARRLEVMTT